MSGDAPVADDLEIGNIVFSDAVRPALQAGTYTLNVTHKVSAGVGLAAAIDETWVRPATFHVRGERLSLDPGELIAVFPPRDSCGEFGNVFPHAVFNRATLPWERSAFFDDARKGAPWLALLVFDDDSTTPVAKSVTMQELIAPPGNIVSYGTAVPAFFAPEAGETAGDKCRVLDLPLGLFWAIAPSATDLPLLAHTRTVTTSAGQPVGDEQAHAVVVANRLAAPPDARSNPAVVHLVSLEGLGPWLPIDDATPRVAAPGATVDTIRLITLASWKFAAVEPKETFAQYLKNLDAAPMAAPSESAIVQVQAATGAGYVALPHTTRDGNQTISWYRGPLAPGSVSTSPSASPVTVADAAIRLDPATGMLDVGIAAAWQLGRAMMLAQRDTALALADWKRDAARDLAVTALTTAGVSDLHQQLAAAKSGDNLAAATVDLLVRQREGAR